MAFYQSEITNFIQQLKEIDPELEHRQLQGRNLLWDKAPLNLEENQQNKQSKIAQKSYVYYPEY